MAGSRARPFGWALIGCGNVGRSHSRWAVETPDIDVRAFCDINEDAASSYYEQYEGGYYTADPARVFADPDIEIVTIATTHATHAELAIAAFEAGKHVYLEKPMAMSTVDCLRIYEAMEAAGRKLMINFSIRFSGATRAIKSRLKPAKVSNAQCMMAPADLTRWQWDPVLGGGLLFDVGVHLADTLCWMHSSPPVWVSGTGGQVTHPGGLASDEIIDTASATIRFANGSVANYLMSDAGFSEALTKWFFVFNDGEQSAVLDKHFRRATITGPDPVSGELSTETFTPPFIDRMPLLLDAIRNDTETYTPARTGILATLVVENIIESIHSGRPQEIELPDVLRSQE
ncbi:MAG: Gfo/Idh/MocA family oxidoreductase [Caldilineaceae bacterium]|nr:Gfo/Idh/MocA family oxidoreductase [Caldilineaceae bacterium]